MGWTDEQEAAKARGAINKTVLLYGSVLDERGKGRAERFVLDTPFLWSQNRAGALKDFVVNRGVTSENYVP